MSVVSIILPTYNRAGFLPQAFASIRAQTWTDWELIIVDDGSTDNTQEILPELCATITQPVRLLRQENQGPYAARNAGLDNANGRYIAFFDSDDIWLPHHLKDCVEALEGNPDVDWVYGACRMVEHASGRELASNTFYVEGKPRAFLKLEGRVAGSLFVMDDPDAARCQILHGLYCGLQNSVIRQKVFANYRFATHLRNEAEDQVIVIRSLKAGFHFAHFDNVHVTYNVHSDNSSATSAATDLEKRLRVFRAMVRGFEEMATTTALDHRERIALRQRISGLYFWHLGYLLWQVGRNREGLQMFRKGLRIWPTNWRYWKTYMASLFRSLVRRRKDITCLPE